MLYKVITKPPMDIKTGALAVFCFQDNKNLSQLLDSIDKQLGGAIKLLVDSGEIKGKIGEVTVIHTGTKIAPGRVVVCGIGKQQQFRQDFIRQAASSACKMLAKKGVKDVSFAVPDKEITGLDTGLVAQLITEGAGLGSWSFKKYFTSDDDGNGIEAVNLVARDIEKDEVTAGLETGRIITESANLAREMVNEPANYMKPADMVLIAKKVSEENNLEIEVFEREQMEELGMRAVLAVAQGSNNPPKFIKLTYRGSSGDDIDLALVGKAVTFDSGGISIKPSEKMEAMKMDMAGGASVISAIKAISELKLKINVVALVAAVENLPSGTAQRPGDVVKAMSGKTIEVISTDAEGRMTLADVLTYAGKIGAKRIVDVATLTGACVIALGEVATGAFTNNQELVEMVKQAGEKAGEYMWQMPMYDEYKEQYKSDVADIKNVGGRDGGAITAALFLSEFVDSTPWVHLDVAGTAMIGKDRKYWSKGGTGVPARTLVNLAEALSREIK
ncbi:MAG: leucyl aminopeptidase [Dehalococcoidales bacterium]|nr:leucyl aminopeptidase [Dehalococcoidales bacterium]MDD3264306.1 leucyl aminopeptidase [Dehalococcoidales bacterium]MDD4322073.1 leucyl aminopeptidase [Dehalococcoidales bacterium]MDD4793644.1 leucyl aminopeptidase [Dehalococcoidales bacterium]MDD5122262.1 leucyl aminopeptidase [Dehalococcoidales bacterium]